MTDEKKEMDAFDVLQDVEVIPPQKLISPNRFSKVKGGVAIDIEQLKACASCCMTVAEAAAYLNISKATLTNRIKTDPAVREAFDVGRSSGIAQVKLALFNKALNGNVPAQALILRTQADWIEKPKQAIIDANPEDNPNKTLDLTNFTVQELQNLRAKMIKKDE